MNYKLAEILSYAVGIAAIIGLIKLRKMDKAYYPFITLLWLGIIAEIISTIVINKGHSNAIIDNIYGILEAILIFTFFRKVGLFSRHPWKYYFALFILITGWIAVNFIISDINTFNSYFNIFYCFSVAILSINLINLLIAKNTSRLLRNPVFMIAIGFIIFFTYKTIVEIFWVYGLNGSHSFKLGVYRILTIINFLANIIYILAVLWIPRKQESLLR